MRFYQLQPRGWNLDFQLVPLRQFQDRKRLLHTEHCRLIGSATGDIAVAMPSILKSEIVRRNRDPKPLVIHWTQPLLDVIYVFKLLHVVRIPKLRSPVQKRLQSECPA